MDNKLEWCANTQKNYEEIIKTRTHASGVDYRKTDYKYIEILNEDEFCFCISQPQGVEIMKQTEIKVDIPLYRAKTAKQDFFKEIFRGGYIENTKETYDMLSKLGFTGMYNKINDYDKNFKKWKYLFINIGNSNLDACNGIMDGYKKLTIKDGRMKPLNNIETESFKLINGFYYAIGYLPYNLKGAKFNIETAIEKYIEVDPSTLAIHHSDMIDSEDNKIFASLDKVNGKGGDLTISLHAGLQEWDEEEYASPYLFKYINHGMYSSYKVIGIQS